ncbi:hypothetical protein BC943DRAFT_322518 [Umbelopsis sp. AD052]|nr:hypothetical protein BC943DRAFT_322518 [Umbelopsis sp. AD052]
MCLPPRRMHLYLFRANAFSCCKVHYSVPIYLHVVKKKMLMLLVCPLHMVSILFWGFVVSFFTTEMHLGNRLTRASQTFVC